MQGMTKRERQITDIHQIADILAEQTGAKPMLFYTCQNITADDFAAGKTYLELMRMNVDTLREALN